MKSKFGEFLARIYTNLNKDFLLCIALTNTLFIIVGYLFITTDELIPYWDLKNHVTQSFKLIAATKQFDTSEMYRILAFDRPPGTIIPLIPFFFVLPLKLEVVQFLFLLFYGNLFVVGMALLGRKVFPEYKISWFIVLPALAPVLWSLTLRPYYDIGPLALTPWLFYAAWTTQRFQKIFPSILLGVVLGLEILFRSYGAYICIAFILAFGTYLLFSYSVDFRQNGISYGAIKTFFLSVCLTAITSLTLAYIPATRLLTEFTNDKGSTAYLWNTNYPLFYIEHHLEILGGLVAIVASFGFILLLIRNSFTRSMVLFFLIVLFLFQFIIDNQDHRYVGAMSAIALFSASAFLSWSFNKIPPRLARISQVILVAVLGHQLLMHLFIVNNPLSNALAGGLYYSNQPVYSGRGNQRQVISEIFDVLNLDENQQKSIYFGKNSHAFNHQHLNWIQDFERKIDGLEKHLIYYADVPRHHGIPEDFLSIDYVLSGQSNSQFNKWLYSNAEASGLLPNFNITSSFQLQTQMSTEELVLWKRTRLPSLRESIRFQQFLVDLDPGNLHAVEQLLWLYKVDIANLISDGIIELDRIARLVPATFGTGNIAFSDLMPLCRRIRAHISGTNAKELVRFCADHGVETDIKNRIFEFTQTEYDKSYSIDWIFMTKIDSGWWPLISNKRMSWSKWRDRKWGALMTDSLIGFDNKIIVKSSPVGIFWVAPEVGRYQFSLSVWAENKLNQGDVKFSHNDREHSRIDSTNGSQKHMQQTVALQLMKGEVISVMLIGENVYLPHIEVVRI